MVATAAQMKELDRQAIEEYHIPSLDLMERAALGVAGALLLGVGMCLSMVFGKMVAGIVVGLIGIVALLMLIPLAKGLKD